MSTTTLPGPSLRTHRNDDRRPWWWLGLAVALVAWLVGMRGADLETLTPWGLLLQQPWFGLAGVAIVVGFAAEVLHRRPRRYVALVHLLAVVLLLHATVPLLSDVPQFAWTYKHLGVVELLADTGRATVPDDIYQQWPAFFAVVAAVERISGVPVLEFARWTPLVLHLVQGLLLLSCFRTITRDPRVGWTALLLVEIAGSWIGQDYLSPQAFAFTLSLGVLAVVLRYLRTPERIETTWARHRVDGLLKRSATGFVSWLHRGSEPWNEVRAEPARRPWAVALVLVTHVAITASHQLTPYLLTGIVGCLVLARVVRPWWLPFAMGALALLFLLPRLDFILDTFGIFSGFSVSNAGGTSSGWATSGQAASAIAVRTVSLTMWGLTVLAVLWHWKRPGRVLVPAVLAFSPFALLVAQNYGGEAIYRVYLFSLPWCAVLLSGLFFSVARPALRRLLPLALAVLVLLGLQGQFGALSWWTFTRSEVTTAQTLYAELPDDALVLLGDSNFPGLLTADYDRLRGGLLPADPTTGADWLDASDVAEVTRFAQQTEGGQVFLVISSSMIRYQDFYDLPNGSLAELQSALRTDPNWTTYLDDGDVTVFQLR